jgi:hypothetical protein
MLAEDADTEAIEAGGLHVKSLSGLPSGRSTVGQGDQRMLWTKDDRVEAAALFNHSEGARAP